MNKHKIHHHASTVIIPFGNGNEFLLDIYDDFYPNKLYRHRAHLIGGNRSIDDNSPKSLLEREIKEEFTDSPEEQEFDKSLIDVVGKVEVRTDKTKDFAPFSEISVIKDEILKNISPCGDFFVRIPKRENLPNYNVVYSVFWAELAPDIKKLIKKIIEEGKSIKNEGITKIISLNKLKSGNPLTAAATGLILGYYFGGVLPNPELVTFAPIGKIRESFSDYFKDFDYKNIN